jgi:pyruvate formate-lyase activating enzyme-like uncharacterized protein
MHYKNFNITGGEPFLVQGKLLNLLRALKKEHGEHWTDPNHRVESKAHVYIYTNGTFWVEIPYGKTLKAIVKEELLDGWNIGLHGSPTSGYGKTALEFAHHLLPELPEGVDIRLHVEDTNYEEHRKVFDRLHPAIAIVRWHRYTCKGASEDWYII